MPTVSVINIQAGREMQSLFDDGDQNVGGDARKHGLLYRQAWLSLVSERQSLRWTFQNLRKLLKSRLKQRFNKDAGVSANGSSEHAQG